MKVEEMNQLATYDEKAFAELARSQIISIEAGIIYYVKTGRNAWHSTWVQQYSNGCMHGSQSSARQYAEKRRTQGTVFTIKELPSLVLQSTKGAVFVTQINTTTPLLDYSAEAIREQPRLGSKLIEGARNNYLVKGATIGSAALSFDWSSRFWRTPPPKRNSVIIVASADTTEVIKTLGRKALQGLSSYSNGGGYLLGWQGQENFVSSEGVFDLVD